MSSFFTTPGAQKKRKRSATTEAPKKRLATTKSSSKSATRGPTKPAAGPKKKKDIERDEDISGSELDTEDEDDGILSRSGSDDSDNEGETAAEKRLRLAQRYLEKTRKEVDELQDEYAFDAEEIDRDLLAERLQEDAAESKGKVYRSLAPELDFPHADPIQFRWNSGTVTSVAVCPPYAYTTTKDGYLTKWKLQDLPKNQWPQTTRKKPKKPPVPPKRRPERIAFVKSQPLKAKDKTFQGHTAAPITVKASQDGKFVVTGGLDRKLVVYDAETLKPIRAFTQHRDAVTGIAFRRGTNQIFSCSKDRTVKVFSLNELAYVETLFGHQDEIMDVDALGQERCVSVGARDRTARYWKVPEESQLVFRGGGEGGSTNTKKHKLPAGLNPASAAHEGSMDRVAMLDDEIFVTGSDNGDLALWSIQRKKAMHVVARAHGLDPALTPNELSGGNPEDFNPKDIPAPQPRGITALRTLPYSDLIFSGSWDGCVRVWRLSDDKKKIERIGVLGQPIDAEDSDAKEEKTIARGIVNDIAVFERGDRGKDGLCVVAVTGKEMRLGRWKYMKEGRCGLVIYEVPKAAVDKKKDGGEVNGHPSDADDEK